ncbi:hypothetical protein EAE99_001900 [Botrytis elliptica]|nr:hypothetical protein EAE99_001900 [Botrytis elliptica]
MYNYNTVSKVPCLAVSNDEQERVDSLEIASCMMQVHAFPICTLLSHPPISRPYSSIALPSSKSVPYLTPLAERPDSSSIEAFFKFLIFLPGSSCWGSDLFQKV